MKNIPLILGISILSIKSYSQQKVAKSDSLTVAQRVEAYAAEKIATARPLNIEYTITSPYKFTAERAGTSVPKSTIERLSQLEISSNLNVLQRKDWMLGATLSYRNISTEANIIDPESLNIRNVEGNYQYWSTNLNFSYFSKLFGKRVIYTSSLMFDGSEKGFERARGLILGTMILKANQKTKMMVGLLGNIDPSAQLPILPTFILEHKFNNGIIADISFPRYLYARKYVLHRGRVSLGTEIDRTGFYLYNIDGTSQKYEYRQIDLNSGLVYEHLVGKHFILAAKTGVKATIAGRLFRKEDSFNDAVLEISPQPTFFANIGISFNPMILLKKGN